MIDSFRTFITAAQKTNMYITAMNNESNTAINNTGVANGVEDLIEDLKQALAV